MCKMSYRPIKKKREGNAAGGEREKKLNSDKKESSRKRIQRKNENLLCEKCDDDFNPRQIPLFSACGSHKIKLQNEWLLLSTTRAFLSNKLNNTKHVLYKPRVESANSFSTFNLLSDFFSHNSLKLEDLIL